MNKILIIEDDTDILDNTIDLLLLENYEPIKAQNGEIGISKAIEHQPQLILCDIRMPGMNGYEVLEKLKENPATKEIPFVFMSSNSNEDDIERITATGIQYLVKPFHIDALLSIIKHYLEARK